MMFTYRQGSPSILLPSPSQTFSDTPEAGLAFYSDLESLALEHTSSSVTDQMAKVDGFFGGRYCV